MGTACVREGEGTLLFGAGGEREWKKKRNTLKKILDKELQQREIEKRNKKG